MPRNQTALRTTVILLLTIGACRLSVGGPARYWISWALCSNEIIDQQWSPGGWRRAVVFVRDCGATTSFVTQIGILPFYQIFTDGVAGNAFSCQGNLGQGDIKIRWIDDLHVEVQHPVALRVWYQVGQVGNVKITYTTSP